MKEQFATYEIAFKFKEIGFDEECLNHYENDNENVKDFNFYLFPFCLTTGISTSRLQSNKGMENCIAAPLWQQCLDHLRDKHGIHIEIRFADKALTQYEFFVFKTFQEELHQIIENINIGDERVTYPTYYDAREKAILTAIEKYFTE